MWKSKILKKRKKKTCLEIWRIGGFPQNLAWIQAAVSEKPELTDACATTVALLTESSRAENILVNNTQDNMQVWKDTKLILMRKPLFNDRIYNVQTTGITRQSTLNLQLKPV